MQTALISSPLISLFTITTAIILMQFFREHSATPVPEFSFSRFVGIFGLITVNFFIHWGVNIRLLFLIPGAQHFGKIPSAYLRYVLGFCVGFFITMILGFFAREMRDTEPPPGVQYFPYLASFMATSFILTLIELTVSQAEKSELELEKAELEIAQLLAQQEQLKQQIHPHFLFNALGTLQILIQKNSSKANEYVLMLAKFLRDSLYLAQYDVITVKEELAFLENYIQLQQMRFAEGIQYDIHLPDHINQKGMLPVFSLQILAENAIKHNAFSVDNPLKLNIDYSRDDHLIAVTNNTSPKYAKDISSGIGLKNLQERYQHFSEVLPKIESTDAAFTVRLKVLGI
ncbi:MAG: histidine kinase [Bacteroidota bacterium]